MNPARRVFPACADPSRRRFKFSQCSTTPARRYLRTTLFPIGPPSNLRGARRVPRNECLFLPPLRLSAGAKILVRHSVSLTVLRPLGRFLHVFLRMNSLSHPSLQVDPPWKRVIFPFPTPMSIVSGSLRLPETLMASRIRGSRRPPDSFSHIPRPLTAPDSGGPVLY